MENHITQEIRSFFSRYSHKKLRQGDLLISPEKRIKDVYLLVSGYIREYIVSEQGVELTVHIYEVGSTFPLMPLTVERDNEHYYESLSDVELYVAPLQEYEQFLLSHPASLMDVTRRLLRGMDGLVTRIEHLTLSKAHARLAACLLYLSRHFGETKNVSITFTHRFTHHEIASIAGLARETVSLELEKMMADSLIAYNGRYIVIPDVRKLESILSSY